MATMNPALRILVENARTFRERNEVFALTEAETHAVNNVMVANLYKSVMEKSHVDFDDIPKSKGDITKYSGYTSMVECLRYVNELMQTSSTSEQINEVRIVEKAIGNIVAFRDQFERGFKLNKDFIILQYNSLVAACVYATSGLIVAYADYIRRVDNTQFVVKNTKDSMGGLAMDTLESFNKSVADGSFAKTLSAVIGSGSEGFTGSGAVAVSIAIIGGVIILLISIREIIFFTYYSRMKISDYLKLQATFLEMNKNNVELNTTMPAAKKKEVLKKQEQLAIKLRKVSDKIKVNQDMTETKVRTEIKEENSGWTLDDAKSSAASTDSTGFQLV